MKSRFICIVSSPNLWEDHHHLILSLRPVMGIQRAGYQTAQSAGKSRNVQLAHLDRAATAEGEQWLLASGQIAADVMVGKGKVLVCAAGWRMHLCCRHQLWFDFNTVVAFWLSTVSNRAEKPKALGSTEIKPEGTTLWFESRYWVLQG